MPTNLGNIKKLGVDECEALTTFPDGIYGVTALTIDRCPRVETLPEGLLQQLPTLEELCVTDCPNLQEAFSRGGAYWNLVELIPRRTVGLN